MAEPGALELRDGPMDGSEWMTPSPVAVVRELGTEAVEAFEGAGVATLQSPEERADWLAAEAARRDTAARRRGPRFRRDPSEMRAPDTAAEAPSVVTVVEGDAIVPERDLLDWIEDRVQAVRSAGRRGTWEDRRGTRDSRNERKYRHGFFGRYAGRCTVTHEMIDEYRGGGADADPGLLATV